MRRNALGVSMYDPKSMEIARLCQKSKSYCPMKGIGHCCKILFYYFKLPICPKTNKLKWRMELD